MGLLMVFKCKDIAMLERRERENRFHDDSAVPRESFQSACGTGLYGVELFVNRNGGALFGSVGICIFSILYIVL